MCRFPGRFSWIIYSYIWVAPMERLQRGQRGRKLWSLGEPPCEHGVMCPQCHRSALRGSSQAKHAAEPSRAHWRHTSRRILAGISFFSTCCSSGIRCSLKTMLCCPPMIQIQVLRNSGTKGFITEYKSNSTKKSSRFNRPWTVRWISSR